MHYSFSHGQPFKCFLKACAGVMQPDITSSALCKCLAVTLCCSVFNHYLCLRLRGIRGGFFFLALMRTETFGNIAKIKYQLSFHFILRMHTNSTIHTHIHTNTFSYSVPKCFRCKNPTHSHSDERIRSNSGFSISPEATLACRLEEPGIKPPSFNPALLPEPQPPIS